MSKHTDPRSCRDTVNHTAAASQDARLAMDGGPVPSAQPATGHDHAQVQCPYIPPRNPVERALCAMLAEVLELERVGIHDDFLELGGQSLQAAQILARIRRELGVELSVRTLIEARTVAELASAIVAIQRANLPVQQVT